MPAESQVTTVTTSQHEKEARTKLRSYTACLSYSSQTPPSTKSAISHNMGNDASTAMQVVNVKNQMTSALDGLSTVPKKEAPRNYKEMKQREKERKQDFERKKQDREQRKSLVAQKWSSHRKTNADCQAPGKLGQLLNDSKQAVAHVATTPKKDEKGKEGRASSWWSSNDKEEEGETTPSKPAAARRESAAERLSKLNPPKPEKKSTKKATPTKPSPSPRASGEEGDGWSKPTKAPAPAQVPTKATGGGGGGGGEWWEQE